MATRRGFLQAGILTAGAGLLPPPRRTTAGTSPGGPPLGDDPYACDLSAYARVGAQTDTIAVTPFVLPLPRVHEATATVAGGVWSYTLTMRQAAQQLLPEDDGPATTIWGYDGRFPGPLLRARRGTPTHVTQVNDLPAGMTVHLHGGHVAPSMDGHPNDLIAPGDRKTYVYGNDQRATLLWYHDHGHGRTAETVHRGLAGLYLIEDPPGTPLPALPSGEQDVPLVLCDRTFDADGQFVYDHRGHLGFTGRTHLVNGAPHPVMEVDRTRYRFRILNASNARRYELVFSDGRPFEQVGTDGGLLDRPVRRTRLGVSPAERVDVVVDLSDLAPGETLHLVDALDELSGRADDTRVMRFRATSTTRTSSAVPATLSTVEDLAASATSGAIPERDVTVDLVDGVWVLDGRRYDPARIDQFPRLGQLERWRFHNPSPMHHPIHLHLAMFQVETRGGAPAGPEDRGWRDTVPVFPGEPVTVLVRFDGHTGTYVYHCHNLEHEDHDMMAQLKVVDLPRLAGTSRTHTAALVSRRAVPAGARRVYVTTADDFPDALAAGPYALRDATSILLTGHDRLDTHTAAELERIGPDEVIVVGGPAAVSEAVLAELRRHARTVRRVAGSSRHATAAALARDRRPAGSTAYVATGRAFPDALGAAATVAAADGALLLVEPDAVPTETAAAIRDLGVSRVVILGGTKAVGPEAERQLRTLVPTVDRIAGATRWDTNAALVRARFPEPVEEVWVATGEAFPDALAGGPGAGGAPLLLTAAESLPAVIAAELRRLAPRRIVLVGGAKAVSAAVQRELALLLPD